MTPSPQEASPQAEVVDLPDPEPVNIVISGISGVYPQMHSVDELCKNLYNKVNRILINNFVTRIISSGLEHSLQA